MLVLLVGLTSGVATVDAELMREWTGQASVEVPQVIRLLGEEFIVSTALRQGKIGATGEPTAI